MTNEEKILKMLDAIQTQLKEHNSKFDNIQTQLKEHGAILGALQHASEVHKAGMDNLTHQVALLSSEIGEIKTKFGGKM